MQSAGINHQLFGPMGPQQNFNNLFMCNGFLRWVILGFLLGYTIDPKCFINVIIKVSTCTKQKNSKLCCEIFNIKGGNTKVLMLLLWLNVVPDDPAAFLLARLQIQEIWHFSILSWAVKAGAMAMIMKVCLCQFPSLPQLFYFILRCDLYWYRPKSGAHCVFGKKYITLVVTHPCKWLSCSDLSSCYWK